MSANYTGFTPDQILGYLQNRYFYGLRRTIEGELFLARVDQAKKDDAVTINNSGTTTTITSMDVTVDYNGTPYVENLTGLNFTTGQSMDVVFTTANDHRNPRANAVDRYILWHHVGDDIL